ncbi:hypothetical protein [Jeotgalibacillus haloalkalitolerans]|uniref:Uncharacterized protein n=1 Tax=Jeotgalibacillus haloalkalitolerans TaxID=3104292 RepID=A0ABU5KI43_9BACL|nr:hypothetical protein [Jeotgalibacillus sp. HH7-29]MDZ5710819.1 hypothetical protein [Jeotgalibacillus sp. HH7-29]
MPEAIFLSAITLLIFHTALLLKKRFTLTERFTNTVVTFITGGAGLTITLPLVLMFEGDWLWGVLLIAGYLCGAVSGYASAGVAGAIHISMGSIMGLMLGEVLQSPALCGLPVQEWQMLLPACSMIYYAIVSLIIFISYRY